MSVTVKLKPVKVDKAAIFGVICALRRVEAPRLRVNVKNRPSSPDALTVRLEPMTQWHPAMLPH